jgi:tetratricopeptide (TPR) repeat protein
MRYVVLGCFSLLLVAPTANAEWLEVSSDHFVIYSEQNEALTKRFAERLERFHAAMAFVFSKPPSRPGPSNRVTVYVVSSTAKVRDVVGTSNRFLAGVYIPRAGASVALIPKLRNASNFDPLGETTLYHEYAHHFMIATLTARAFPRWFTEGFAEFFSSVQFKEDGSVVLGAPSNSRAAEIWTETRVPLRTLLSFDGTAKNAKPGYNSFYGQSWLLFHYLQMAKERAGELTKYQSLLAINHSALEAAEGAFGDLGKLKKDLDSYLKRRQLNVMIVADAALEVGAIAVRKVSPGEEAMMPIIIESNVGVTLEEARNLVSKARKVAALHPDDPAVLEALAEAEFDADNDAAAIAAADRALAIDPKRINAHIQKGYAMFRQAESGALPKESWKDVRRQFIKANSVENDNPIPLMRFYMSYLNQGERPTKNAIDGLEWAMHLAPFDESLRWLVAQQMVADKRDSDAAQTLAPLAYSPHPGEHTDEARQLLKEVEARLEREQSPSPDPLNVE